MIWYEVGQANTILPTIVHHRFLSNKSVQWTLLYQKGGFLCETQGV
jgi:hypothetical protein